MYALRQPNHNLKSDRRRQSVKRRKVTPGYHPLVNNQTQVKSTVAPARLQNFQTQQIPANLQVLLLLQKTSFAIAILSTAASLGLYVVTVRVPQLWSQEYQKLENLQQQERQLTAINESLKYQLASEAGEKNNNLSLQESNDAVFIPPAEVKVEREPEDRQAQAAELVKFKYTSFGY
jgi:hypothetical protein